jgi:hypothetical protein
VVRGALWRAGWHLLSLFSQAYHIKRLCEWFRSKKGVFCRRPPPLSPFIRIIPKKRIVFPESPGQSQAEFVYASDMPLMPKAPFFVQINCRVSAVEMSLLSANHSRATTNG